MRKHHTKEKGDLGVLKAQVDIHEQGFKILIPVSEHLPFDIVGWKDGKFTTFQVKYRTLDRFGTIPIQFRSSWTDKNGTHVTQTNKTEINLFVIYCPDTDKCYYIDPKKFKKSINLRVSPSKNNQEKGCLFASDYCKIPL